MADVVNSPKRVSINPLKMSQPLGAAMAFMGVDRCMPVLHGSQGCTSFGLVLLVRHFKEAIPFQTTAMNEVSTILGGIDNIEEAVLNIVKRAKPRIIAIASTGLVETRGEDVAGDIKMIRKRHPELADTALVYASTPDFAFAFQDGWAKGVTALIEDQVVKVDTKIAGQVNILVGCHVTPGDIEEIRDMCEAFGLSPLVIPDISGSLDGHIEDNWLGTTTGGTTLEQLRSAGASDFTFAIGEQMRPAAEMLRSIADVPYRVFPRLSGLFASDSFVEALMKLSGRPVPAKIKRQRSQLQDAMLDGHFYFGNQRVAIGAEPDLLANVGHLCADMGAFVVAAVTTTHSPVLAGLPVDKVVIGDLDDLETAAETHGATLLMTHSHGRQAAERLSLPLYRIGFPSFDHIGAAHKRSVLYRGTRDFIFELSNVFIDAMPHHGPEHWTHGEDTPTSAKGGDHARTASH